MTIKHITKSKRKIHFPYCLIILFLLPLISHSQYFKEIDNINADSLRSVLPELSGIEKIDALNKIALDMSKYDRDSSIEIANRAKVLAEAMDYQKGIADAFFSSGRNFLYKDSLKPAYSNFLNALRIYENLSPCAEMGMTLEYLNLMNMNVGRFDKAKVYAKQELKVFKQLSNRNNEILAIITNGISHDYDASPEELDSAFYYYSLALDLLSLHPDTSQMIAANNNMLVLSLEKYFQDPGYIELVRQHIKYGLRAIELFESIQSPTPAELDLILGVYLNLANAFTRMTSSKDSLKMALGFLESANRLSDSLRHFSSKISIFYKMGDLKYKDGDYSGSIQTFKKGLQESEELYNTHSIQYKDPITLRMNIHYYKSFKRWIYNYLYYIYDELGDYQKALEYYILKEEAASELYLEENKSMVAMLEAESENEKTEKKIAMLEQDKRINQLKVTQSRYFMIGMGVLFIILILMGMLLLRQNKLKSEHKSTLLEQKLLRLQMNPHFIFNALSNIMHAIEENENKNALSYLHKFSKLLRTTLESSREDYILLEDEINSLEHYLELQKLRFEDKFEYSIEADKEIDLENAVIPPMLIQPFIENAIEHGIRHKEEKGHVIVRFLLKDKKIVCEIEDDGVGREKAWETEYKHKEHKSLATNIIMDRIQVINKKMKEKIELEIIDLKSEALEPLGTKVVIGIPLV